MRFFKGSLKVLQSPKNLERSTKKVNLPEDLIGNMPQYYSFYKHLKSYDDEQKLILMAMHYNTHLTGNL